MTSAEKRKATESIEAWLYLAPALAILCTFWFLPIIISLLMSFGNITALKPMDQMAFVGVRQYTDAFRSSEFHQSLWNTVNYALYAVPVTITLAMLIAMTLNGRMKGRGIFRTIFFLPYITTWVAVSIVFKYLFDREYGIGNWLLEVISLDILGMESAYRLNWLAEPRGIWELFLLNPLGIQVGRMPLGIDNLVKGPSLSLACVIATSVWRDVGYAMVIILAGLQNIDRSLYEAASIDGAGPLQKFRAITFPLLSPVTFFILTISMIGAFKVFIPQFMMTPTGGPDNTTTPMVMYLYEQGFTGEWKLSYAAAVAYILTLIILALTLFQNRLLGKRVEYGH